ncbi:insulin-like growth factor-binding protein complex acid labile subunit [Anopheles merus]|uniref:insulin-like growth factor-binding protein complex acid labile subunit n=1 Tax=Anopheles merus TaxID=30066 RepID=UPI001BE46A3C|nr:insulin-like growth factor-binding protein complex acid labile subunit [Anopheles merus]
MYLKLLGLLTLLVVAIDSELQEVTTPISTSSEEETNAGVIFSNATTLIIEDGALELIEPALFESFPNLTHLQLSPRVRNIQPNAFASLKALTSLNLDNNLFATVPREALFALSTLKTLSIANNLLESLDDGDVFLSLARLQSLSLGSNLIHRLHPQSFARLAELKLLNVSWNRLTSFESIILPRENQLQVLDLSYNYVKLLNVSTFHRLPALGELSLAGNQFESLHPSTFATLRHLSRLDLSDNFFQSLPPRLFTSNRKLVELNLAANLLDTLPGDLFAGLKHLTALNLRNNRLTKLPATIFREQPPFAQLTLEGNRIERFPSDWLQASADVLLQNNRLARLRKFAPSANGTVVRRLFLYGNEIATVEQDVFRAVPKLETLYLDYNRIDELSPMVFHTNHELQHVTLSHNRLAVLRTNTFAGLARLHSVDLSYNRLAAIEESVFHGSPVEYLNLNGNRLRTLDEWSFSGTRLLYLYVDSNAIGAVQVGEGDVLEGLVELSVASNRLDRWQELCARNFSRLSALNLANNSLPSLEQASGCLGERTNLDPVTVNVGLNKVSLIPEFAGPIRSLDLSGNSVEDLEGRRRFERYQQTEVLLLRKTSLRALNSGNFAFLPHLTELAVSSKFLETIEEDTLLGLKLQRLELTDSPLKTLPNYLLKAQRNISYLSLANNELTALLSTFFTDCVRLEVVDLSGNALSTADKAWFEPLEHLKSINLEDNRITQLPADLLSPDTHALELLSFAGNALHTVSDAAFLADVPIRALNLSSNRLEEVTLLARNEFITQLDVSGNRLKRLLLRPNYRTLVANANQIGTLEWDRHYHAKSCQLELLSLADNLLERLDQRVFQLATMVALDVSENRLDAFPFDQLHWLKRLTVLNVSRNNIRTLPVMDAGERFKLDWLDLSENPLEQAELEHFLGSCVVNDLVANIA